MTLTVTEFLILQALAQRPGIVKSRDALMDAAYDDQVYVDDRTIDSHIKRLRKKFKQVDDRFRRDRDPLRRRLSLQGGIGVRTQERRALPHRAGAGLDWPPWRLLGSRDRIDADDYASSARCRARTSRASRC